MKPLGKPSNEVLSGKPSDNEPNLDEVLSSKPSDDAKKFHE